MTYNEYPKGSEWNKWDLHFHTPSSYDYKNGSVTNEDIINELKKRKIRVVAITDHDIIYIERIKSLQRLGKAANITVLPGIELRCELGGSKSIHFIGIFSEKADIENIWIKLQGHLGTEKEIKEIGHDKFYVDFRDTAKIIHEYGGIVTIHSGEKSNSLELITNSFPYKMALKTDMSKHVDIFEMGKIVDLKTYNLHFGVLRDYFFNNQKVFRFALSKK